MIGKNKERWEELCEQAVNEQDSTKLTELVRELTQLLEEKQQRLQRLASEVKRDVSLGRSHQGKALPS